MSSSPEIVLVVGGSAWRNWTRYELDAQFTSPADSWSVEVDNPTSAQWAELQTATTVALMVGDQVALRGWLERKDLRRSTSGTTVSLGGRDLAAPLTDCGPGPSYTAKSTTLVAVAQAACAALGVSAKVVGDTDASATLKLVKAEAGETWWQIIERYATKARLMVWMTPTGELRIGRPDYASAPVATLVHAQRGASTVLDLGYTDDITQRFTQIEVLGQARGSDGVTSSRAAHLKGAATDDDLVSRGLLRTLVVDAGDLSSSADAQARAEWEVSHRRYQGETLTVTVPGHGPTATTLWAPDQQVSIADDMFGLSGTWWIDGRRLTRSREGTKSSLTLKRPKLLMPEVA